MMWCCCNPAEGCDTNFTDDFDYPSLSPTPNGYFFLIGNDIQNSDLIADNSTGVGDAAGERCVQVANWPIGGFIEIEIPVIRTLLQADEPRIVIVLGTGANYLGRIDYIRDNLSGDMKYAVSNPGESQSSSVFPDRTDIILRLRVARSSATELQVSGFGSSDGVSIVNSPYSPILGFGLLNDERWSFSFGYDNSSSVLGGIMSADSVSLTRSW